MPETKRGPYRWRTWLRMHLPLFLIDIGIADKGEDCEAAGGYHEWYSIDNKLSGCYHCKIKHPGKMWGK